MNGIKYFVEIGACDFDNLVELAKHGWGGIVVEPIKEYYDRIPKYDGVAYVNAAIDTKEGNRTMNVFKQEYVDKDHDFAGMSSFAEYTKEVNRDRVAPRTVPTITYQQLLERNPIPRVDFLKIDTEGHDWKILQTVVFEGPLRPTVIKFEYKHFRSIKGEITNFLERMNYLSYVENDDMYAISKSVS